jgi:hypothetical protein
VVLDLRKSDEEGMISDNNERTAAKTTLSKSITRWRWKRKGKQRHMPSISS